MTEDQALDAAPPPLPPGLSATPDAAPPRRQAPPVLPITPRLPGTAAPSTPASAQPAPPAAPATAQPPAPAAPTPTPPPPAAAPTAAAQTPATAAAAPSPTQPAGSDPDSASADGHDHDTTPADTDNSAAEAPTAAKPPIGPAEAVDMATGMAGPALQAALGIPAGLFGIGSGLLAPFAQILNQFGQGTPAMPSSSGFPEPVLDSLTSIDPATGMTGLPADAYQSDVDAQANQAHAMDNLERKLRATLQNSAANSKLGRSKIEQIINQVKSTLQALGPIANTPMGQMGVLTAITQGLQQAGAVLTEAVGKDALNADTVKTMSADYIKDLNATSSTNDRDQQALLAAGGPQSWAIRALAANGITHPRAVANWLPGLLTMGKRESGNNPYAVNGSDSNAAKGTPSKGWMQTIEPTFRAHWRPGTSQNIFDPVANAAAAIHYVMTRYNVSPDGSDLMAKVQQANPYAPPKGY